MNEVLMMLIAIPVETALYLLIYQTISSYRVKWLDFLGSSFLLFSGSYLFQNFIVLLFVALMYAVTRKRYPEDNKQLQFLYCIYTYLYLALFAYPMQLLLWYASGESDIISCLGILFHSPLLYGVNYWIMKKVGFSRLNFLKKHIDLFSQKQLLVVNIIFSLLFFAQISSYVIENNFFPNGSPIRMFTIPTFILVASICIVVLNFKIKELNGNLLRDMSERQIRELSVYVKEVENLYNEVRSFRHDYKNTLISMNEVVKSKDVEKIQKYYHEILHKQGLALENKKYYIAKLENMEFLPLKSLLMATISKAQKQGVHVMIEVEMRITHVYMPALDFIRVCSVLLDNAREAAAESEEKLVHIAIFIYEDALQFHVKNSYKGKPIKVSEVMKLGYTTKGPNRGSGLTIVENIMKNYFHIQLGTKCSQKEFIQQLSIRKNDNF
ncbi:two-component system, AgrA family, sensor histidine kinase AgrC [Pilibacter termitis]|uniref:Two-component system, AgrA family, sensor histidine kinase AgrC n=1 Tax=Pilibacter termitis TaxID=263852 RepID=A0A1T4KFI7_9ENTE|nr:GHKL domain-containing protein [Pilibacter termitis]SJZ41103.1 two-component system, AgrA family, sensor histidine kinase AgrC [Pilibacter termitis]